MDMQRALRLPQPSEILWDEAQSYWITEQSIKAQSSPSSKRDSGKSKSRKKDSSSSSSGGGKVVTYYTCGEEGHYPPDCPNSNNISSCSKSSVKDSGLDSKKHRKNGEYQLVCYKCGGMGHK